MIGDLLIRTIGDKSLVPSAPNSDDRLSSQQAHVGDRDTTVCQSDRYAVDEMASTSVLVGRAAALLTSLRESVGRQEETLHVQGKRLAACKEQNASVNSSVMQAKDAEVAERNRAEKAESRLKCQRSHIARLDSYASSLRSQLLEMVLLAERCAGVSSGGARRNC